MIERLSVPAAVSHRRGCPRTALVLACLWCLLPAAAAARQSPELASLSLEDLMKVQITSATRQEQSVLDTAAAVYVITQEDIRRSGLTTIPEILRLAPGVHVARMSKHCCQISIGDGW